MIKPINGNILCKAEPSGETIIGGIIINKEITSGEQCVTAVVVSDTQDDDIKLGDKIIFKRSNADSLTQDEPGDFYILKLSDVEGVLE